MIATGHSDVRTNVRVAMVHQCKNWRSTRDTGINRPPSVCMHAGGRTDAVLYGRRSAFAFAGHDRRLEGVLLAALSLQLKGGGGEARV